MKVNLRLFAVVVAIVAIEGFVVLDLWKLGHAPLDVYDYQVFHNLAVNLLDHHTFSQEDHPPYDPSYYRGAGYPTFIALIYAVFGRYPFAVRAAQFVVLAVAAYLTYLVARRFFSERVAAISAVLCATYPPLVFASAMYLTETLATAAGLGVVLQAIALRRRQHHLVARALILGVSLGILTYIRPSSSLFAILIAAAIAISLASPIKTRAIAAALIIAGYGVVIAPWLVRNSIVCGRLAGPAGGTGWSLYLSAEMWAGEKTFQLLLPEWNAAIPEFNRRNLIAASELARPGALKPGASPVAAREIAVDHSYYPDALAKFRSVPLRTYLMRSIPRMYWLWSTADLSPWGQGAVHRFVQSWHVFLFAFAFVGALLWRHRLAEQFFLWLLPVYLTALHFVFHVEARYTLPARPYLWIYAAAGMDALIALVSVRDERAAIKAKS